MVQAQTYSSLLARQARQGTSPFFLPPGILIGLGQVLLKQLSSGNGIDTTEAIWFHPGRMPALQTLGSALLSIFAVGMGASIGREGAPKQAGAVFASSPTLKLSPTSSGGCLWLVAPDLEWQRLMASLSVVHSSPWR